MTNQRGRPTKCTPALIKKAEKLMGEGHYAVTVAKALGIGESTWYDWLEWADDIEKDPIYSEFSEAVTRGETKAEMDAVAALREAAVGKNGDWRANLEYLKRRYRDRWSEKIEQEVTGKGGVPLRVIVETVYDANEAD